MTPGFELDMSRAIGPLSGVFSRDQARQVLVDFAEYWESARVEPHEFIEAGDLVVVPYTLHVRGRDGVEVVSRPTTVWKVSEGLIECVALHQERHEALEAVALSEQDVHTDS